MYARTRSTARVTSAPGERQHSATPTPGEDVNNAHHLARRSGIGLHAVPDIDANVRDAGRVGVREEDEATGLRVADRPPRN
jgi:hypothetical protein